jgi:hypothetical protein
MNYFELRELASLYGLPCLSDNQVKTLAAFVQAACDKAILSKIQAESEENFPYDVAYSAGCDYASAVCKNAFKPIYTRLEKA